MLIPWTSLATVSTHIGLGVFATQPIPAGTIVWTEDTFDSRVSLEHFRTMPTDLQALIRRNGYIPFGEDYYLLSWDSTKYFNHSCEPNCLSLTPSLEIAVRDIAAGEQLTNHYAFFGLEPHDTFTCYCEAKSCHGTAVDIEPNARLLKYHTRLVEAARKRAALVPQPLAPYLEPKDLEMLGLCRKTRGLYATNYKQSANSFWVGNE